MDAALLADLVGHTEISHDTASASQAAGLAALLDYRDPPWRKGALPPLGHWLQFPPRASQSDLGPDGHPVTAGLLPRRMWAGSRVSFLSDIPFGAELERCSTIVSAIPKQGKTGQMIFVTRRHEIAADGVVAVEEFQDIVYRAAALPGEAPPPATEAPTSASSRQLDLGPVALFRYSALTFNSHRIHYDRDYTRDVEGYAGLVVHGPLLATLLLDHYCRANPAADVAEFSFRAVAPLFDTAPVRVDTEANEAWASGPAGLAVRATITPR